GGQAASGGTRALPRELGETPVDPSRGELATFASRFEPEIDSPRARLDLDRPHLDQVPIRVPSQREQVDPAVIQVSVVDIVPADAQVLPDDRFHEMPNGRLRGPHLKAREVAGHPLRYRPSRATGW